MSKQHSNLAPSASKRWINCSGSILMPQFNEERDTTAADEGTLIHKINEYKLIRDEWYDYEEELEACRSNPLYHPVMEHYSDDYTAFIQDRPGDKYIEEFVDLGCLYPDLFGTADCIVIDPDEPSIEIIDFKYGKWKVDPEENTQLMIYALGAVRLMQKKYPDTKRLNNFPIRLTIYQPRIKNIQTWETDWKALSGWCSGTLVPALSRIQFDVIEQNTGDWCRFCPARIFCKAYNDGYIGFEPEDIKALSDSEIEEQYLRLKPLEKYLGELKSYLAGRIHEGYHSENFKLVRGNNKRSWKDAEGLIKKLEQNGINGYKLVSPAELEKLVGRDEFEKYTEFVKVTQGKPLFVKREDRREELIED